jgi:hypothetical protein
MIFSSRNILDMRARLLAITPDQWLLLVLGVAAGGCVWLLFNRRIVHRIIARLKARSMTDNVIALVEGAIGGLVFVANAALVYVATLMASFFLFAFACVGTVVGAWIAIPASFE